MRREAGLALLFSVGLLGGCAYNANPSSVGPVNVVSAYNGKVPGKFALVVEPGDLNKVIRPRGLQCSAHSFPLDMSEGFRSSVRTTLGNVVDEIEEVPSAMDPATLRTHGFRGQITVRGEALEGKLIAIPGFWTNNISTTIQAVASVTVDGPGGRVVGKTVEGLAERESEVGAFCEGGAVSVEEAATQAMRKLVLQLGETVANSDRLRQVRS